VSKFGVVFLILLVATSLNAFARPAAASRPAVEPGVAANERITALTGALLYVCIAAITVTVLFVPRLLPEHYLAGFLAIPPLGVKLASTGYRFARYYAREPAYRRAGAPPLWLRFVVAPVLVASTVAVFGTGIELWLFGVRFGGWWITAHTVTAVVFMTAALLHMLSHLRRSGDAVVEDLSGARSRTVFESRSIIVASLVAGGVLAAASLTYSTPFGSIGGGG
jgi:hypothetical protein